MKIEIEYKLSILKGFMLSKFTRCINMGCFVFIDPFSDRKYELHLQCPWRIEFQESIFVAQGDMYLPASNFSGDWDEFDWDKKGSNLFDEKAESYHSSDFYPLHIMEVTSDNYGGIDIYFDKKTQMKVFINSSTIEEQWRLLRKDQQEDHFVVSALAIES